MSAGIAESPQTAPSGASQVADGDASIPEVSSSPGGAQSVTSAPSGTIPAPLRAFSDRPDSAKNKTLERLRARAARQSPQSEKKQSAPANDSAVTKENVEQAQSNEEEDLMGSSQEKSESEEESKPATQEAEKTEQKASDKKQKVNPWKLVEEHKTKRGELEKEISELRKMIPNAEARKLEMKEIEDLRARSKELEEHIRFVDFTKSKEYQDQYDKPYQEQWRASMRELDGVRSEGDGGEMVAITPNDMLELVNLPLIKAKELAIEKFGDFASDVLEHRRLIREKFEAREGALAKAREDGDARQKQAMAAANEEMSKIFASLRETYDKATAFIKADKRHSEFLSEREGDEEGNAMLARGYQQVDEAFAQNPMDAGLTAEQRASIVKKHSAIRHKAAAYSRLTRDLAAERAAHAATKKKLSEFTGTVPNRGSTADSSNAATATGGSKMSQMQARLRSMAYKSS